MPTAKVPYLALSAPLPRPGTADRLLLADVGRCLNLAVDFQNVFGSTSARLALERDDGKPIDRITIPSALVRSVAEVLTLAADSIEAEQAREAEVIRAAFAKGRKRRR